MMNYKNCRWLYPNYTENKDICLNGAIEEEVVNDEICDKCSHYFSYDESLNKRNNDNITDNILGDLE